MSLQMIYPPMDIFASQAQTLVNAINCAGVMGKGLALAFKQRFPEMYADYVVRCKGQQVRLGEPYLFRRDTPPWIINFPTKQHWRSPSHAEDIVAGMVYLQQHYQGWGITSLAVPALGCGLGGLAWEEMRSILETYLVRLDIPIELYAPAKDTNDK
jgi:O-acetyl-ADP-ribose deacetylase (regulator of RNase III)